MYSSVLYLVKHRFNLQPASEEDPLHLGAKNLMHLLHLKSSNISCSVYESCMVFFSVRLNSGLPLLQAKCMESEPKVSGSYSAMQAHIVYNYIPLLYFPQSL
jgi:hypothetical protein